MGTDDWNKEGTYVLDTSVYHGAPSSVKFTAGTYQRWLCMDSAVDNLKNGRLETWWRVDAIGDRSIGFLFRMQGTTPDRNNFYQVEWGFAADYGHIYISDFVGGGQTVLKSCLNADPIGAAAWVKRRVVWYSKYGNLYILVQKPDNSGWTDLCTYEDSNDRWAASSINRAGPLVKSGAVSNFVRIDDTVLYGEDP